MTKATCSVPICDEKVKGRGWCKAHYQRWLHKGDPGITPINKKRPGRICGVAGCDRPRKVRDYCMAHYGRWRSNGDPGEAKIASRRAVNQELTYGAAHQRVGVARGAAKNYLCACGKKANAWAYQYNDPDVLVDSRGCLYSGKPEFYEPMCGTCHKKLDTAERDRMNRVAAIAPGGLFY